MQDLVTVLSNEDGIQISLDVQQDAVLQIGEMMQEIQEEAYMNGENWAVFFNIIWESMHPIYWRVGIGFRSWYVCGLL